MPRKRKKPLEFFDKEEQQWIRVSPEEFNEEMIRIYDYIQAEMAIMSKIARMKIDQRFR